MSIKGLSGIAVEVMLGAIPQGIVVVNADNSVCFVNEKLIQLYKVGPVKLEDYGDLLKDIKLFTLKGEPYPLENLPARQALLKGTVEQETLIVERVDGSRITIDILAKPVKNEKGNIVAAIALIEDITESKQKEAALKESAERLKFHYENSPLAVVEWDANFKVTRWAGEAEDMFGWSAKETVGKPIMDLNMIYEPDLPIVTQTMVKLTDGKTTRVTSSNRNLTKDGKLLYCTWYNSVLYGDDHKMCSVMSLVEDNTGQVSAETKLKDYAKDLEKKIEERTNELKSKERMAAIGQTASMVGHDIRNPLQAITGELYLARQTIDEIPKDIAQAGELRDCLNAVQEQVDYINKIVLDLQDIARPLKPEYQCKDIADLILNTLDTIAVPDNISLKVTVDGELILQTDPTYIKRSLTNLVNNAVQAMPEGGELKVTAQRRGQSVFITVSDTGKGIPDEVKPTMFTPLMTTKAKGQGLGLAVVKRLVEALNGKVSFESEKGKGTKFTIELQA